MKKVRALIVDDSFFLVELISQILERSGKFTIVGKAYNGEEAVKAAIETGPDIISMDIKMPGMKGLDALSDIINKHICPVVMVSAHTNEGSTLLAKALTLGAIDYIKKPGGASPSDTTFAEELVQTLYTASSGISARKLSKGYPKVNLPKPVAAPISGVFN